MKKKAIEAALEELKQVKDRDDKAAIEAAIEKLSKVAQKLAEEVYKEAQAKQQAGAAGQQGSTENAKKDDDIEDAEIVD